MQMNHYSRFFLMIALHFIAMYIFMYSMVNAFDNVFNSLNQAYMAALMTASMVLIRSILMCKEASIQDQEIKGLCRNIIASQQAEIDQMKGILDRMNR